MAFEIIQLAGCHQRTIFLHDKTNWTVNAHMSWCDQHPNTIDKQIACEPITAITTCDARLNEETIMWTFTQYFIWKNLFSYSQHALNSIGHLSSGERLAWISELCEIKFFECLNHPISAQETSRGQSWEYSLIKNFEINDWQSHAFVIDTTRISDYSLGVPSPYPWIRIHNPYRWNNEPISTPNSN